MKRRLRVIAPWLVAAIALASFLTRPRPSGSPHSLPLLSGAQVDPEVLSIFDRSCRDCHSEATRYPWYSYVAPVSLLISDDVTRGRKRLNLSRWNEYSDVRRQRALSEIANQVTDRGMPLQVYVWLHPNAALSDSDVRAVFDWTQKERLRLITRRPAAGN